jgi:ammonium transporter Rh
MLIIATFESFFWCLNESLVILKIEAADIGGTMVIHMFGAYFGLVCSYFFKPKEAIASKENVSSYNHNLTAFLGTIFLFMYWPSFNGAL